MLPKKIITKKHQKKEFRKKLVFYIFCLIALILIVFLALNYFLVKEPIFINPISEVGYRQNSVLEDNLKKNKIEYQSISFQNEMYKIILTDGIEVIMPSDKDIAKQVSSLQLILTRLKIEGKDFKSLDFRFDKPVVR